MQNLRQGDYRRVKVDVSASSRPIQGTYTGKPAFGHCCGGTTVTEPVNSLTKQLFLTSVQVRCIAGRIVADRRADRLRPIKRCDDLATGRRSWHGEGPAGLFLPDELTQKPRFTRASTSEALGAAHNPDGIEELIGSSVSSV